MGRPGSVGCRFLRPVFCALSNDPQWRIVSDYLEGYSLGKSRRSRPLHARFLAKAAGVVPATEGLKHEPRRPQT